METLKIFLYITFYNFFFHEETRLGDQFEWREGGREDISFSSRITRKEKN